MLEFSIMTDPALLEALSMGVILKAAKQASTQRVESNVDVTVSPVLTVTQGLTGKKVAAPRPSKGPSSSVKVQELLSLVSALPPPPARFAEPRDMEPDKTTGYLLLAGLGLVVWKFKQGSA